MGWTQSELLFYGGIVVMVFAVVFSAVAVLILHTEKKRLLKQLEKEYGKEWHEG